MNRIVTKLSLKEKICFRSKEVLCREILGNVFKALKTKIIKIGEGSP